MKTVALTGAAGYLGRKLLPLLDREKTVNKIICIDLKEPPLELLSSKTEFYRLDIRDLQLSQMFNSSKVDTVIHLAFVMDPIRDRAEMHSINKEGTANVLEASEKCSARHLIVASSTSVFGAFPDNPSWLDEDAEPREHAGYAYAADKYAVEKILRVFTAGNDRIKVAVIRPCIVYGSGANNYLSRFILNWPFLLQIGAERPVMQFVHEDDVARAFMLIFNREASGYYHIVGEGVISTTEIAGLAGIKLLALPPWLVYPLVNLLYFLRFPGVEAPAPMLDFIRYRWTASDLITRSNLGFKPRLSSKEVMEELLSRKKNIHK